MLNIQFKRNSQPIDDEELLSVIDGIRQAQAADHHPNKIYALLLSKMVFRIHELQTEVAARLPVSRTPFAHFQWNSGWQSWEQVIESAAGEDGVVAAYSILPHSELAKIMKPRVIIDLAKSGKSAP